MKNMFLSTKTYIVVIMLFVSPLYPQSIFEAMYNNKKTIGHIMLLVAAATCFSYGIQYLCQPHNADKDTDDDILKNIFDEYAQSTETFVPIERHNPNEQYINQMKYDHADAMIQTRLHITQSNESNVLFPTQINIDHDDNDDAIRSQLADKKIELINKPKNMTQTGVSKGRSLSYSGSFDIANASATDFTLRGTGLLNNCCITENTYVYDDIIAHSSQLKGAILLNAPTSFVSFDDCLLGTIQCNIIHKDPVIELLSSIVEGDIHFVRPGVVIVNDTTIITGMVTNGRVIRNYNYTPEITITTPEHSCNTTDIVIDNTEENIDTYQAVTINGYDVHSIIQPDEIVVYEDTTSDNITLKIKDNAIRIGSLNLQNIENVRAYFQELNNVKHKMVQQRGKVINLQSGQDITLNGADIEAEEKVLITAQKNVRITDALFNAKKVVIAGSTMEFDGCFIDANELQIESAISSSLCLIIHFTFNKDIDLPTSLQGSINFTGDNMVSDLLVVGAQKIAIKLAPHVFTTAATA